MTPEMKKILDKAKKLKALADRGVGGEKVNARALLDAHLEKHGITEEELFGSIKEHHHFRYEKNQQELLEMIICNVVCNALIFRDAKHRNTLLVACSKDEAKRIRSMFAFYMGCFEIEKNYLLRAFIHKNNLEPNIKVEPYPMGNPDDVVVVDAHDEFEKQKHEKKKDAQESETKFDVKTEPAPVQEVRYSPAEQKKIQGLMSWMQRYVMSENLLNQNDKNDSSRTL